MTIRRRGLYRVETRPPSGDTLIILGGITTVLKLLKTMNRRITRLVEELTRKQPEDK